MLRDVKQPDAPTIRVARWIALVIFAVLFVGAVVVVVGAYVIRP
jgi:hypothetical protein